MWRERSGMLSLVVFVLVVADGGDDGNDDDDDDDDDGDDVEFGNSSLSSHSPASFLALWISLSGTWDLPIAFWSSLL